MDDSMVGDEEVDMVDWMLDSVDRWIDCSESSRDEELVYDSKGRQWCEEEYVGCRRMCVCVCGCGIDAGTRRRGRMVLLIPSKDCSRGNGQLKSSIPLEIGRAR